MAEQIIHTIAPIYNAQSQILLLGTAPSPKSREAGFFYGHPQNRFWRVMAQVLDEPLPQANQEKRELLLRHNVALWDVLHACTIEGAADASIRDEEPNDLTLIFKASHIKAVFATGTKAASLYKKHQQSQTGLPIITLPSTSPANCAYSLDALVVQYRQILTYL